MEFNFLFILLAVLIPVVIGFIYYHPKLVGTAWIKTTGLTEEKMKDGNMAIILGVSLLLSFLISTVMAIFSTHQTDLFSLFNGNDDLKDASSEISVAVNRVLELAGDKYLTFKHGAAHGMLMSIFLVFPVMAIKNLFERRPFKLTLINSIYWMITLTLMAGVLCQWGFKPFMAG